MDSKLLNQFGNDLQISVDGKVLDFYYFTYSNGRKGIYLKSESGDKTYVTFNDTHKKVKDNEIHLRDYDEFKGLNNYLLAEGVIESEGAKFFIGKKETRVCKLINNG